MDAMKCCPATLVKPRIAHQRPLTTPTGQRRPGRAATVLCRAEERDRSPEHRLKTPDYEKELERIRRKGKSMMPADEGLWMLLATQSIDEDGDDHGFFAVNTEAGDVSLRSDDALYEEPTSEATARADGTDWSGASTHAHIDDGNFSFLQGITCTPDPESDDEADTPPDGGAAPAPKEKLAPAETSTCSISSVDLQDMLYIPAEELQLKDLLGEGRYGEVYRADFGGEDVAVKVILEEEDFGDFLKEFKVLVAQAARCSSVVRLMGYSLIDGKPSIVMHLYETTLLEHVRSTLMETRAAMPMYDCLSVVEDVCQALLTLHRHGLVHADVKPENIFVERRDGRLRAIVGDFGLCSSHNHHEEVSGSADDELGTDIVGTLRYCAPEATNGIVTPGSDMWSLGGILAFCVTGIPPWFFIARPKLSTSERSDRILAAMRATQVPVTVPNWLPKPIIETIEQCMDYDPAKRPTARQVKTVLRSMLERYSMTVTETRDEDPAPASSQSADGPGKEKEEEQEKEKAEEEQGQEEGEGAEEEGDGRGEVVAANANHKGAARS
ncbi:unnamed protein product [Pedinophyceae sp. YPF-701]|nr:unnamed protein product [Pedinophyceae sp. YPF-701]